MFRKSVCWEAVVFATDICPYSVFSFVKTITPCHIIAMSRHAVCNLFAIKHQRVPVAPPRGRGMITGQSRVLPMLAIGLSPLLPRHRDVRSWAHVFSTITYYSHLYTGLWFGRRSVWCTVRNPYPLMLFSLSIFPLRPLRALIPLPRSSLTGSM